MIYSDETGRKVNLLGSYIILIAFVAQAIYMQKLQTAMLSPVAFKLYTIGYIFQLFNSIALGHKSEYIVKFIIFIIILLIEHSSSLYVKPCN